MSMTKAEFCEAMRFYASSEFEHIPTDNALIDFEFSDEFNRKMEKVLKTAEHNSSHAVSLSAKRMLLVAAMLALLLVGVFSVGAVREYVWEFINGIFEQKDNISAQSRVEYANAVEELSNQLDSACLEALQNNTEYCEYYISLKEASELAVSAYENYITCKFDTGNIGLTLVPEYKFLLNEQAVNNLSSLLNGTDEYHPIAHSFSNVNTDSYYFEQILALNNRISNCTSNSEALEIHAFLDDFIASLQKKAENEISQSYAGISDTLNKQIKEAFDRMLFFLDKFEESNNEALELIQCGESYKLKSRLYARLEKAIMLCGLI